MALVTRFFAHKHSKRPISEVTSHEATDEQRDQLTKISHSWKRIFSPREKQAKGRWVPAISNILKAGDEGIISSTLFDKLNDYPGELTIEALYEIFAEELKARPFSEKANYTGPLPKFLWSTKNVPSAPRRVQSVSQATGNKGRRDVSAKTLAHRKSADLSSMTEWGTSRTLSVRRPTSVVVPLSSSLPGARGSDNRTPTWYEGGQIVNSTGTSTTVSITPAELAALSIVLGCPVTVNQEGQDVAIHKGAFGISISTSSLKDGRTQVALRKYRRTVVETTLRNFGYCTALAKHLASGSLPFRQDGNTIKSILITNHTFQTLQRGESLSLHESSFITDQAKYLSALPRSHELKFHILSASQQSQSWNPLLDAVAALPFTGGLTPLASHSLLQSVGFIASGGLPPARLLQRLEGLVDRINGHGHSLNIFGPLYEAKHNVLLYRERERLGKLATDPGTVDSLANKVARMQRYITLLQRLMALVPSMKHQEVLVAVQQALRRELERSYSEAVTTYHISRSLSSSHVDSHGCPASDARSKRPSTTSRISDSRSKRASTVSVQSTASPNGSATFQVDNLGKQMEAVLKAELPLSIDTIAFVARMVLVAWTLSVESVAWEAGEDGFRVPDLQKLPSNMVLC